MASTELKLAPNPADSTPEYGFVAPQVPKEYYLADYPQTSPLGILEEPFQRLQKAGKTVSDLVLGLPARAMDVIFGNNLWP